MSPRPHQPSRTRIYTDSGAVSADWRLRGLCRYDDPELWWPTARTDSKAYKRLAEVPKEICRRCPVVETCLNWALDNGVTDGVFGGADEQERMDMLAGRAPRRVPLPRWRLCETCGKRKVRPTSQARRDICADCIHQRAEDARLRRLRRKAKPTPPAALWASESALAEVFEGACPQGHPWTAETALWVNGVRRCKRCREAKDAAKDAIVAATQRVLLASRGELAS